MFSNQLLLIYPLYCAFRLKQPLPTNPNSLTPSVEEEPSDHEGGFGQGEQVSYSEDESEPEEVRRTRKTTKLSQSGKSTSRKSSSASNSDEDTTPTRTPLGNSYIQNKHATRLKQLPTMGSTTRGNGPLKKEVAKWKREAEEAKAELEKVKKKPRTITVAPTKIPKDQKDWTPRQKAVYKCAKTELSQKIKFIYYDDEKLTKATRWVMNKLQPEELEGLEDDALEEKEAEWIAKYRDFVRLGLNEYRNYCQGEVKMLFEKLCESDPNLIPTKEEMLKLAMREGLEIQTLDKDGNYVGPGTPPDDADRKAWEAKLDCYLDKWVGKVAGQDAWARPNIKYYKECSKEVDAGTEAFLVVLYENGVDKWLQMVEQKQAGTYNEQEFAKAERERVKAGGTPITPYTTATSGACPWGGWNEKGRKRFRELQRKIRKNRVEEADFIHWVEETARKRIHAAAGRVEIDAKKKAPRSNKSAVVHEPDESDDDEF